MSKASEKIKEEFHALLPPTLFFFVTLHLIALIRVLMLKGTGIELTTSVSVTIAALVLGKTVLIADMLPFINRYPDKPLAYNVAWKTMLYVLVSIVIHYLERLVDFWKDTGGFIAANEKLWAEMIWPHFLAIQILLAMLVLVYCTMRELVRLIGREKMGQIFFG